MKSLALVLTTCTLAACGGGNHTAPVTNATGAAPGSGSGLAYAKLFVRDAAWTLAGQTNTTPPPDLGPPSTKAAPAITCKVKSVEELGAAKLAEIACTAGDDPSPTGAVPPAGLFVATPAGLWWFASEQAATVHELVSAGKLDPKEMLLAAAPMAHHVEGKSDDEIESWMYESKPSGAGWCVGYAMAAGDEAGWEVCFDHDHGVVSASNFSAGATTIETTYKVR